MSDPDRHAICTRCGRIYDARLSAWYEPQDAPAHLAHEVNVFGALRVAGCRVCSLTEEEQRRLRFVKWLLEHERIAH